MLEDIRNNIARLISRYEEQRQRADSLAAKLSELEGEVRKYREQITELNQQIDNLRLLSAFMADPDPKDARAGKEYELPAETPEMEQLVRTAAEQINGILAGFDERFHDARMEDKLVFAAVQLGVGKLLAEKRLSLLNEDIAQLGSQLEAYLESSEKQ